MAWIGWCDCHGPEDNVACSKRGRRLKHAYPHAMSVLREGLAVANSWTVAQFEGALDLWRDSQGCVRFAFVLGEEKIGYLDVIPHLLARLDCPGVRQRCVQQWEALAPDRHSLVSREFMDPAHPMGLRQQVDAMDDEGQNIGPVLAREIRSLQDIPMDDCIAEGPHARGKRVYDVGKASKGPWVASTMRLRQNLKDIDSLPAALDVDLQTLWDRWNTVVKCTARHRPLHRPLLEVFSNIYHMSHCATGAAAFDDVEQHGGDGADGGEPNEK